MEDLREKDFLGIYHVEIKDIDMMQMNTCNSMMRRDLGKISQHKVESGENARRNNSAVGEAVTSVHVTWGAHHGGRTLRRGDEAIRAGGGRVRR